MKVENKIKSLTKKLHNSIDVASRVIKKNGVDIGFIYLKSITDNLIFSQAIFEPVSNFDGQINFEILEQIVKANDVSKVEEKEIIDKILKGSVVVMVSNSEEFLAIDILNYNTRAPSEPPTSPVIMGPREGFTEDLKTNMTLIRRRFYSDQLVFEEATVGDTTKTQVVIAYLDGIADEKIVKEIKKKI